MGSLAVRLLGVLCALACAQSPYDATRPDFGLSLDRAAKQPVVASVDAGGPAEAAGVAVGDRLVAIDGTALESADHFHYLSAYALAADRRYRVQVARGEEELELELAAGAKPVVDPRMASGGRTVFRSDAEIFPDLAPDHLERALLRLVEQEGQAEGLAHLQRVLVEDVERKAGFFRLDRVTYAQRNPVRAHRVAERLAADFEGVVDGGLGGLSAEAARWLDLAPPRVDAEPLVAATPAALFDAVEALLARAHAHRERAFAALDATERAFLAAEGLPFAADLVRHIYVDWEGQPNRADNLRVVELAKRVDVGALAAMGAALAPLYAVEELEELGRALSASAAAYPDAVEGVEGRVIAYAESPHGRMVVGGIGPNTYRGDFAFILDLGGDDAYPFDTRSESAPAIEVLVDIAGDDTYGDPERPRGPGTGWLGAGIAVDLAGDDRYLCRRAGQGFGWFGFGLLLDAGGADRYALGELGQGAGWWGIGALVDRGPESDVYEAALYAQGLGLTRGLGLLLEEGGDESYRVGGAHPSSYGTEGVFRGFGQGMGLGLRWIACGGVGLLLDRAGNDRYDAGNFSQGGGYFMAMGVLADRAGADSYAVTRYGQGFGCHSAAGMLLEGGGDDVYTGRIAANQGAAWDAGVGVLIEAAGDDRYKADGLSLGAGAQNGFALCYDGGGADLYETRPKRCLGHGGGNTYWWGRGGAPSLGILLDVGGAGDRYPEGAKAEGATTVSAELGLFCDRDAGLLEVLRGDPDVDAILEERRAEAERREEEARLTVLEEEAAERLAKARRLVAREKFPDALEELAAIAEAYPRCPSGQAAAALRAELEADPAVQEAVAREQMERDCRSWLSMGRNLFQARKYDEAAGYFEQIVTHYPDSSYAEEAQEWLEKLR